MDGNPRSSDEREPADSDLTEQADTIIRSVVSWRKWSFTPEDQEDLYQEIRVEVRSALSTAAVGTNPGLAKTIAIRRCIDRLRRKIREHKIFVSLEDLDPTGAGPRDTSTGRDPVALLAGQELRSGLASLLKELGETCRQAIEMFYMQDLKYADIAGRLGISINTVGSRLHKCLAQFREAAKKSPVLREYLSAHADRAEGEAP